MRVLRGREERGVEVDEGEETKVDEEAGMGVEVDGLEMGVGVGVEKNLVLAAERAPLMKESG